MAMTKQEYKNDCIILSTLEELVPKEHLVRKLDNCIDFRFIEELVKDLYSIEGRPSIPPVVLFKLIFINIVFGINSMRRTCEDGFVLANTTNPGNVHDSIAFFGAYNILNSKFKEKIKNVCLDAGYVNPAICVEIILSGHTPLMPYKRPMTGKGLFKKYEYAYDEYYDCYICPNNEVLLYTTTDKNGYKLYKSNPEKCKKCPLSEQCTKSKNCQKVITRHVWEEYKEQANENRYTKLWKDNYPLRKETIERTFGDCKEQHGLRFTRVRGLLKNEQNATMIFACHNLKKMANWRWGKSSINGIVLHILEKIEKIIKIKIKKVAYSF